MANSNDQNSAKLQKARDIKAEGTRLLKNEEYSKAISVYKEMLEILEGEEMVNDQESERKDLVQAGQLNIALCWMKLKLWNKAKLVCGEIIGTNQNVVKVE